MRMEFTAEELQAFAIAFDAGKPYEVEDVFEGMSQEQIMLRANEICGRYIKDGVFGSPELEKLLYSFFYSVKVMSVSSKDICWLSIFLSEYGWCGRYYDKSSDKYILWTISGREEATATILKTLKLNEISVSKKQKICFSGKEFKSEVDADFYGKDTIASRAYHGCINNDLMLCDDNVELGYPMTMTTQFTVTSEGILYLKSQMEEDRVFVEAGMTDTQGLINAAFYEIRTK